jgi:L-fucose mutarotase
VIGEFEALLRAAGYAGPIAALDRFAYYERTRGAYAIVATGERRYWGNLILKKGAIPPTGPAA